MKNRKNKRPFLILDCNGIQISERNKADRFHSWEDITLEMNTKMIFNIGMNYKVLVILSKATGERLDSIELGDYDIEPHQIRNAIYKLSGQTTPKKRVL